MNKTNLHKAISVTAALLFTLHANAAEPHQPAKLKDKVTVKPGQNLTIQFQAQGDSLKGPKTVKQPDPKQPSVALDLSQSGENVILHIKNGFRLTLRVRCLMRLKGQPTFRETSIIPIPAGLGDFESWRDPIEQLVLFDFKLQ
jgi:hypothetical protein